MKITRFLPLLVTVLLIYSAGAQSLSINATGAAPHPSAVLDITSTTKGLLIPRLTNAQRDAIASPAGGLCIYNSTSGELQCWNGSSWMQLPNTTVTGNFATGVAVGKSVAISANNATADPSAMLDVQSNTGGFLLPRMSTVQRNAIPSPLAGLVVFNSTSRQLSVYTTSGWRDVCGTSVSSVTGTVTTTNNVGINTNTPHPSAMVDVSSVTGGLLLPRLSTAQRDVILSPAEGLVIYNTTTQTINVHGGNGNWMAINLAASCCGSPITDARDGQVYNTVQIGTQCWMAENLNYGSFVTITTLGTQTPGQKYCYEDSAHYCDTYGGMYEWTVVMSGSAGCNGTGAGQPACTTPVQGICPTGWHVPSHYEWTLLERAVCTSGTCASDFPYNTTTGITTNIGVWRGTDEGAKLKEAGTAHWTPSNSGTNTSGFTALPTGAYIFGDWNFLRDVITDGYYWTSSNHPSDNTSAIFRQFEYGPTNLQRGAWPTELPMAVRCLKD